MVSIVAQPTIGNKLLVLLRVKRGYKETGIQHPIRNMLVLMFYSHVPLALESTWSLIVKTPGRCIRIWHSFPLLTVF